MPRYTLKSLLIAVTIIGTTIGLLRGCFLALTHVETGENVDHVSWLPNSASNVSYYESYGYTAYEFDMSEDDFKKWVRYDVKPITEPFHVLRYSHSTAMRTDIGPHPTPAEFEAWQAIWKATIKNGLYHSHRSH